MVTDAENRFRCSVRWQGVVATGLVLAGLLLFIRSGRGQDAAPKPAAADAADGLFITVHNPITTNVVSRVKDKTMRFLQRPDHRGLTIVYDLNPDGNASFTGD